MHGVHILPARSAHVMHVARRAFLYLVMYAVCDFSAVILLSFILVRSFWSLVLSFQRNCFWNLSSSTCAGSILSIALMLLRKFTRGLLASTPVKAQAYQQRPVTPPAARIGKRPRPRPHMPCGKRHFPGGISLVDVIISVGCTFVATPVSPQVGPRSPYVPFCRTRHPIIPKPTS